MPELGNATDTANKGRDALGGRPGREAEPRSFGDGQLGAAAQDLTRLSRNAASEASDLWRSAFGPLVAMQMEATRWLDGMWRQTTGLGAWPSLRPAQPFAAFSPAPIFGAPPSDVKETNEAYLLTVELPGLTREDIDLSIEDGALRLRGHKSEEKEETGVSYRISERRFGRFERLFPLPPDIRREGLEASFRDGVLKITLPKASDTTPQARRIQIGG